jgi:MFS family permease
MSEASLAASTQRVQNRTVRTLAASQALGGIAVAGAIPAGALIAASISGSEAAAGLAQTFGVLGAALLALPLAKIALAKGRRVSLATGYALGTIGALIVIVGANGRSLLLVYLGCLGVGVATASGYQARYAATDLARPQHVGRALAWVVWAATIGAIIGPNLLNPSGSLGLALGLPQLSGPYLVSAIALGLAVLILLIFLRPDPYLLAVAERTRAGGSAIAPKLRDGIAHVRARPDAMLGIAIIAVGHVVMVMVMVMTPVHMAHVDVTLQLIGLVISVHVAGMYALSPVVGWATDRWGTIRVALIGIAILVLSCVLAGLAPADDVVLLGLGLFGLGLGWSCTLIAGSALVTKSTDARERPAVQGLSDLVMNVAGALGGAAAGLLVWAFGYLVLCLVAIIPLLVLVVFVLRRPACRTESNTRSM